MLLAGLLSFSSSVWLILQPVIVIEYLFLVWLILKYGKKYKYVTRYMYDTNGAVQAQKLARGLKF